VCLPAFETEHAPPQFIAWFESAPKTSRTAIEELGSILLVYQAGSDVGDIDNSNGISAQEKRHVKFISRRSEQGQSQTWFKVVTCFAIKENE
jgi:hypothetical protein